jgi:hypothetical protein
VSGMLICYLCELAGRPAGDRFKVPASERPLMEAHVLEPHLAQRIATVAAHDGSEVVDLPLEGRAA